jgi:hypothetical protein
MAISRKNFYVQCETCLLNETIEDSALIDTEIEITVAGKNCVSIKCKNCGNEVFVADAL